jgi:hypothetical protein
MRIRCSQVGKLMTASRSKGEVLSQTAKTYIQELALEKKYGIKKEINSKYLDKGIEVEDDSIILFEKVAGFDFLYKNTEFFSNDYVKGTPDIITDTHVIDVKSSWTGSTFPWFEEDIPNKDYFYQLQAYMWLTGKKHAILAYCLVDTPLEIVQDEIRRLSWAKKELEISDETIEAVTSQHEFSHIPMERRVKSYIFDYDEEVIEQMKVKIEHAREYFNQSMETI